MNEQLHNQPEITKDYELHNIVTGEMAAAALVSLLRGDDPTVAVAEWTAGTDGHSTAMVTNLGQMRGELKQLRLKQVEAAVDADGKSLLDQFQGIMSKLIAERLNKDVEMKVTTGLAHIAELTEIIEHPADEEERQRAQALLDRSQGNDQKAPPPIRFVIGYHGIEPDSQKNNRADNGIIEEAFDRLYQRRFDAIEDLGGHDVKVDVETQLDDLFDHLNGLFPSKLGFEISATGTVTIDIDGKQLELTAAK